jgi:hypothetical protein
MDKLKSRSEAIRPVQRKSYVAAVVGLALAIIVSPILALIKANQANKRNS